MSDVRGIFDDAPQCSICHQHRKGGIRLTHFQDGTYRAVVRCRDSYRCRETVEAAGNVWPLLDDTAAPFPEVTA